MFFSLIFGIDENVIEVYYHKNIEYFCQNLVDIALERDQYVSQSKRYHLIFKIVIADLKNRLPFIFFLDLYLIVGIG